MIFQERPSRLGRWLGPPVKNQIGHRSFGDVDSQLEQFAMDSGCTPERIGLCHSANKISDLTADRRPPGAFASGLELPEQLETLSMPPNDSFGFDDDQCLLPIGPKMGKQNPEETISFAKSGPFDRSPHCCQLLAEYKVFQREIIILFRSQKYAQNQFQQCLDHR